MSSDSKYESSNNIIANIDAAKDEAEKKLKELKEPKELSLEVRINKELEKKENLDPISKINEEIEFIKKEIESITSDNYDIVWWQFYLDKKYEEIRDIIWKKVDEFQEKGGDYDDVKDKISKLKNLNAEKYVKITNNIKEDLRRKGYLGGKKSRKFKRKTKKGKRSRKARKSRRKSNRRRGRR